MLSWLFVGALFLLCGVLGVLQYGWIGEISLADAERLHVNLQANLNRLSRDFNAGIAAACRALAPVDSPSDDPVPEADFRTRYDGWKTTPHGLMFQRIAVALPQENTLALRNFNLDREAFETAEWPATWQNLRRQLELRLAGAPPPMHSFDDPGFVFELPLFGSPRPDMPPMPILHRETGWLIFELDVRYISEFMLPELLQRYLSSGGSLDYEVEVVTKARPPAVIYESEPGAAKRIAARSDASVSLLDAQDWILRRRAAGPDPPASMPDVGHWQMFVRHRAGSLEAVVSRARWRNVAVTACILLLMVASLAALIRYTRQAQKLAALQMDFVAGISHELRTPLAVIHTAAYNLRGALARNPGQVERYGALIQQESGKLKDVVEQIMRFAAAKSGRGIRGKEAVSVEAVIEDTVESSKAVIQGSRCVVEKTVEPDLPLVLGDPVALKHVLQNLISNAAKYGTEGSNWIGVSAVQTTQNRQPVVEICVADRGPGIPADEQAHIFDPFFRGRRALQDQVHGTGLGLSLVKDIVEAHGGTIGVHSEPAKGTEFVVRIPVAPPELQDEFAHSLG